MKITTIGKDPLQGKDVRKVFFESEELPKIQLFNSNDVIAGNPGSNLAIGFVYTWKQDRPPAEVSDFFQRIANYAALTGLWRTTNGGRYAISNILANPNINKLVLLVFGQKDNGHLLVDALENLWKHGVDRNGVVRECRAANPKFEQVPLEALERLRKQADLVIVRNITGGFDRVEKVVKAMIQEPENAVPLSDFSGMDISRISNHPSLSDHSPISSHSSQEVLYDDGARFDKPFFVNLSSGALNVKFESRDLSPSLGQSIQAQNLGDALSQLASFIYSKGSALIDMRDLDMIECRSVSITIMDPLEAVPGSFSREYIDKYVDEFMNGVKTDTEFAYTYHERIFKRWGNQVEKVIELLKSHPNTRRACISLWDPFLDLGSATPPCLDFIWLCIRDRKLEMHAAYRSHHLATVTDDGRLMPGEGAFVPNLYALGTLQKFIADRLDRDRGPLVLTDFSGHVHVAGV